EAVLDYLVHPSALWTFLTPGWPENTDALRQFHPTSVMVSGSKQFSTTWFIRPRCGPSSPLAGRKTPTPCVSSTR
ncbi:hypothetical protein ACXKGW_30005, partial [Klebsiella pneumoniae subsp. pneumoniae]